MPILTTYFDYKSPYAYVHKNVIQQLAVDCDVEIDWRPYSINITDFFGGAEVNERGETVSSNRDDHQRRRVKYFYMDCRRLAAQRGLTFHSPRKVFQSRVAHVGMLYAKAHGKFQNYHDLVFEKFWRRELDLDSIDEITEVLRSIGVETKEFAAFLSGEGIREHDRIVEEANNLGVFGVPSFIVDGELYWGAEHLPLIKEKLGRRSNS